jgi:hypothetical protein
MWPTVFSIHTFLLSDLTWLNAETYLQCFQYFGVPVLSAEAWLLYTKVALAVILLAFLISFHFTNCISPLISCGISFPEPTMPDSGVGPWNTHLYETCHVSQKCLQHCPHPHSKTQGSWLNRCQVQISAEMLTDITVIAAMLAVLAFLLNSQELLMNFKSTGNDKVNSSSNINTCIPRRSCFPPTTGTSSNELLHVVGLYWNTDQSDIPNSSEKPANNRILWPVRM